VSIRALLLRNWRFKNDLVESKKINELFSRRKMAMDEKLVEFPISRTETLRLTNQELIYLESAENYVAVAWGANSGIKKAMIRMTMKEVISLINDPLIVFCHRSYIINLRKVSEMIQQSGSSAIVLNGLDRAIPVSPRFKTQIKEKLLEV
jgi:DNA-binding LytR/AlgR family response regulator